MKTILALCLIASGKLFANDDQLFLKAIAQIESGNEDAAIGKCGSRGRYQIGRAAWAQHSTWPYTYAHNALKSRVVAMKHLAWLRKRLLAENPEQENIPYGSLALAWRYGSGFMHSKQFKEGNADMLSYRMRVLNLYQESKRP